MTRVYNILKLRFPNSNVSLPQLLTGAQQYIDMIAAPPGGGGQGGGDDGGEDEDEESNEPHYYIYIDNQKEHVADGKYTYDPKDPDRYMWDFMVKKCIDLFWADNEKQRFNDNYIKKESGMRRLRTITIEFKNIYEDITCDSSYNNKEYLDDLLSKMMIMHVVTGSKTDKIEKDTNNRSQKYKFHFYINNSDNDIMHSLKRAKEKQSRITTAINDSKVNNKNIATYFNAVYRESEKRIEEIKEKAKNQSDIRAFVFNELADCFLYDKKALEKKYGTGNNLQTALATNSSKCWGMSCAYFVIMNELGIKMGFVDSPKNNHAWNYEIEKDKDEQREGFWYDLAFQVPNTDHPEIQNPKGAFYRFKNDIRYFHKNINNKWKRTAYVHQTLYHKEDEFEDDIKSSCFFDGIPENSSIIISDFNNTIKQPFKYSSALHTALGDIELPLK